MKLQFLVFTIFSSLVINYSYAMSDSDIGASSSGSGSSGEVKALIYSAQNSVNQSISPAIMSNSDSKVIIKISTPSIKRIQSCDFNEVAPTKSDKDLLLDNPNTSPRKMSALSSPKGKRERADSATSRWVQPVIVADASK